MDSDTKIKISELLIAFGFYVGCYSVAKGPTLFYLWVFILANVLVFVGTISLSTLASRRS